jgi:riboflavin kinase/FMN adenylyltransferase
MKVHHGLEEIHQIKNPVVTTGSFDGVHVGHKAILKRLRLLADTINGESVLITFYPHPRKVLYPGTIGKNLKMINSQAEKIDLLSNTGLDHLVIIHFTREFSKTPREHFVEQILINQLHAKIIVVGFNHYFGYNREGDYQFLFQMKERLGFEVEEIPEQDIQNETVSSTKIREALKRGNIQRANAYLDHFFSIRGYIKPTGFRENGSLAFQLDMEEKEKLIPPTGAYAISYWKNGLQAKGIAYVKTEDHNSEEIKIVFIKPAFEIHPGQGEFFFHKRVGRKIPSANNLAERIYRDWEKIEELIY